MQVTLTPQAEQLLRQVLAENPGQSPEEIVERALAASVSSSFAADPVLDRLRAVPGIKLPGEWPPQFASFKPVEITGESISEQLIRERR